MFELREASIIIQLMLIVNDKRHDAVTQTFTEEDKASHTPVSILKRMNSFKSPMIFSKCQDSYIRLT